MSLPVVIGHEEIRASLRTAADNDVLPHALVFTGPAGVGKALVARDFTAGLLCEKRDERPCGRCPRCIQLGAGTHPDFMAVSLSTDKKEIGVDVIRQLKRFISLHAAAGRHKVAIIDDADRLSIAAQNALLKTLEEPPAGSYLILVTASPRALLPTVRSRCRLVNFQPLTVAQVEAVLRESSNLSAQASAELAPLAEGSPGYALQLRAVLSSNVATDLEQMLADLHPDRYVSVVRLARALGRTEQEMVMRLRVLYARCHAAVRRAVHADGASAAGATREDGERLVRRAAILAAAVANLQRRNPNRPLLGEAVALQLARA